MYKIEKKPYGYKLTFEGFILPDEMKKWVAESRTALAGAPSSFGVLIDMRTLKPLSAESQVPMQDGQKLYKARGMVRSAVVLNDVVTKMQFQRIGKSTGIYAWERYVDASSTPNWEQVCIDWVSKGKDPDQKGQVAAKAV